MKNYLKYLLSLLLFGSNGIISSQIANSGLEIVFMRTGNRRACSGGDIAAWRAQIHGAQKPPFLLQHNSLRRRGGLSWIMIFPAYSHIGVSLSSLLYYCGPVIVMLLSPALFCEKLTLQRVCARARGDTLRQRRCRQRQP